ncbi:MAG: hypothetical protein RAK24_05005 [TACK group archaeon]|nr:hypothetical protein [TACK group archaeon]
MSNERTAFALVLSGYVLQVLAAVVIAALGTFWPFWMGFGMMGYYRGAYPYGLAWLGFWLGLALVSLGLGAVAIYLLGKEKPDMTMGSILALLGAVLAFPLMWGFMIGSLLMFVGALLGLTERPRGATLDEESRSHLLEIPGRSCPNQASRSPNFPQSKAERPFRKDVYPASELV